MTIFLIGAGTFTLSSIYFYLLARKKNQAGVNTALYVSLVTIASYLLMYSGAFSLRVGVGVGAESIYFTRWLFYIVSCSLLVFEIGKRLSLKTPVLLESMYQIGLVMLFGFLATITESTVSGLLFVLGCVPYFQLYGTFRRHADKEHQLELKYFTYLWTLFPVVMVVSPLYLGALDTLQTAVSYFVLDILTKIVYYMHTDR